MGANETAATRPWGSWQVLDEGPGYKVKRIEVHPRRRLSLQRHDQRSEHWVVVTGKATCQVDDTSLVIGPGECADVGIGQLHRIANDSDDPLVVIEVQRGDYCGEDDIERLDDDYGRCPEPREPIE